MKNRAFWSFIIVLLTAWSLWEMNPLTSRDLLAEFDRRAQSRDATLTNILAQTRELQKGLPTRVFGNLLEAIGTNDITRYFPFVNVSREREADRTLTVLHRLQQDAAGQIKLGLDLRGGTSFLVAMDTNALSSVEAKDRALEQAIEVLRKRVDRFGVAEPVLQPAGENRILIQLPGLSEQEKADAKITLQKAAFLEFRLVHPKNEEYVSRGATAVGYTNMTERPRKSEPAERGQRYLVERKPVQDAQGRALTGAYVQRAQVIYDQMTGAPEIQLTFNGQGEGIFGEITQRSVGRQMAIILDGELYSAPVIKEAILGGNCVISGKFDVREAVELANVLMNPLEAPVKIIEERGVDPTLGRDSIRSGFQAALIGTAAICVFMIVYYLFAGLVANVALILNVLILMGVMCSFDTTLTLPGIAGIVLTIGMAVDANVLIYERIREESEAGKSLRGAISAGYSRAFGTIFDSNLTTLISSAILIFMGTGPVKGFGVTLTIGVSVSMFTALIVTRMIFDFLVDRNWLTKLPMLALIKGTRIDFIRYAKPAFAASWTLVAIGIGYGFYRGHDALGVDFAGGDQLTLRYNESKEVGVDRVREVVSGLSIGDAQIQYQRDPATGTKSLMVTVAFDKGEVFESALTNRFPEANFQRVQLEKVGAVVGKEIQKTAVIATLLALFGILVYVAFRYEFSFAVAGIVSLLHDIGTTLGWFFLSGRELSAPIVAAILTIIGFSINDTIVIFDRIREDLRMGMRGTFRELMNHALNRTLSRTIITSGTVFLATLSLYLFGGGVINDFAFTFLVGILTGTYSSIFIASPLVLWWHKGQRPHLGSDVPLQEASPTAAAAVRS